MTTATFHVTGTGTCCAIGQTAYAISYRWAIGSILFSCAKANKGVLEMVVIKNIMLNNTKFGQIVPIYVDTYNWYWNEEELCIESVARANAISYLQEQQDLLLQYMASCHAS